MWIVWSGPKSNLSKILWLSSFPASLMTIRSKMKSLSCGQCFPKSMEYIRASNSQANSWHWAKIKLVQDFMAVLITCQFDEDPIKNKVAIARTTFSWLYVYGTFWLPWKPKFRPVLPKKTYYSQAPTPVKAPVKFDQDWRYSCSKVLRHALMHGLRNALTDGWRSLAII